MQEQFLEALKEKQNAESSSTNGLGDDHDEPLQQLQTGGQYAHRMDVDMLEVEAIAEAKDQGMPCTLALYWQ